MWKKRGYGGIVLILIYFIYAVFFKKIPAPLEQMQKDAGLTQGANVTSYDKTKATVGMIVRK